MRKIILLCSLLLLLVGLALPVSSQESDNSGAFSPEITSSPEARPTNQLIIKFTNEIAEAQLLSGRSEALPELSAAAGVSLAYAHPMSLDAHVLRLPAMTPLKAVEEMAVNLSRLDGVLYAEPDRILSLDANAFQTPYIPDLVPNDTRWNDMWHLRYVAGSSEGVNLVPAWDISTGSASTVVAVIDTGILAHNDLAGKILPGYDFIANVQVANDGNGRDPDPTDPGDWITSAESTLPGGFFEGCQVRNSSWHGLHVAGTIGAATNNNLGIAGVDWNAKILPIRVLGKCGGFTSDIVDGMVWSAGLPVVGVPNNPNPAKVLNLSLGGVGACSATQQTAINQIVAAGSTIVVAAGNSNQNVSNFNPANCNNVIAVASNNRTGSKASYSNFGSLIKVSAPGGETNPTASNGVLSTLDTGTQGPSNSHTYAYYQGTSMAAPHVAGVASLIVGMRPAFTQAQVLAVLQSTARPFPAGSTCNTSNCGSGIVDAYQALSSLNFVPINFVYLPAVMKPAPPPPPPNPIVNPSFESGPTGWTQFSSHGWQVIINSGFPGGVAPRSGTWAAWLGGDYDDISYVQQQVTVPAGAPYLAYWHWIASQDVCGYDFARVRINGANVHSYNLCSSANTNGWVKKVVNLGAYVNQSVTLQVRVETDGSLNSNLFLDDFAFQATAAASDEPMILLEGLGETAVPRSAIAP